MWFVISWNFFFCLNYYTFLSVTGVITHSYLTEQAVFNVKFYCTYLFSDILVCWYSCDSNSAREWAACINWKLFAQNYFFLRLYNCALNVYTQATAISLQVIPTITVNDISINPKFKDAKQSIALFRNLYKHNSESELFIYVNTWRT